MKNKEIIDFYVYNSDLISINKNNKFIYESSIYLYTKNYFSMINTKLYESKIEIPNVVKSYFLNNVEIYSVLIEAPENWIKENNLIKYIKP